MSSVLNLKRSDSYYSESSPFRGLKPDSEATDALRSLKAEFAKTKAILEQKLEFQETEINEMKEKSIRDKQCYETMFQALKSGLQSEQFQSLDVIKQFHEKQVLEIQNEHKKHKTELEARLVNVNENRNKLELELSETLNQLEKYKLKHSHVVKEKDYHK